MADLDPFAVLGITRSADAAIVRAAYRLRALEAHPDRVGVSSTGRMKSVTAAYALLADLPARARWEAAHPVGLDATRDGRASQHDPASARADRPTVGSVARRRLARRTWQWVAVTALVVGLYAASVAGREAVTFAALSLGLAWLADQVPTEMPFWPARDVVSAARATGRACLVGTSALIVLVLRRLG